MVESRQGKRKRIFFVDADGKKDPDTYVDVPVVSLTPIVGTRGQVFNYRIVNDSRNDSRQGVTKRVFNSSLRDGNITYDQETYLDVERPRQTRFLGTNAQLFKGKHINFDPAPATPENAAGLIEDKLGHYKVHYVRFYKDNNDDDGQPWITLEMIDRMNVVGSRGQLFKYKFHHPTADDYSVFGATTPKGTTYGSQISDDDPYRPILGYCPLDLELMPEEIPGSSNIIIDPPWRLSPDRNIVNVKKGGTYVLILWIWSDSGTLNLGERCIQTGCAPDALATQFIDGIQSRYYSAKDMSIEYVDEGDTLLHESGTTSVENTIHPTVALGYPTYRDCVQCDVNEIPQEIYPCSDPNSGLGCLEHCSGLSPPLPPIDFPDEVFADPVPFNHYSKSFLFDISASSEEDTSPLTISFDITGLPNPKIWTYFVRTLPFCPQFFQGTNLQFATCNQDEYISNFTTNLGFQVYVFNKSDVDVYTQDDEFPVRKKAMVNPASDKYENNWPDTIAVAVSRTTNFVTMQWADASGFLHEGLSNAEDSAGTAGTGSSTGGNAERYEFTFQNYKLTGIGSNLKVTRPVFWPSSGLLRTDIIGGYVGCGSNLDREAALRPATPHEHSVRGYLVGAKINGVQELVRLPSAPEFSSTKFAHSFTVAPNEIETEEPPF